MKKSTGKTSKYERTENKKRLIDYHQSGKGEYIFRNKSASASLELPKNSMEGKKWIPPKGTWRGDSYFLSMVPRDAVLVEVISEGEKESKMPEKLILDQPDQVTCAGKVEHKVEDRDLSLNETSPEGNEKSPAERLLNEDPMSGITIIRD